MSYLAYVDRVQKIKLSNKMQQLGDYYHVGDTFAVG